MDNGVANSVILALAAVTLPAASAIIVAFIPRWSDANERRRTRYAKAVEGLIAWAEYPYRVARRTIDSPETLNELAAIGHTLQERLAFDQAWVSSENAHMGNLYSKVLSYVRGQVGPATLNAWQRQPVTSPHGMNIGDLSINQSQITALTRLLAAVSQNRFGWRRVFGSLKHRIAREAALIPGATGILMLKKKRRSAEPTWKPPRSSP